MMRREETAGKRKPAAFFACQSYPQNAFLVAAKDNLPDSVC